MVDSFERSMCSEHGGFFVAELSICRHEAAEALY